MGRRFYYKSIQLPQLRSFCLAAAEGNFTTAAERLGAEHTRLYYTLDALQAQVLRVRAADAGSAEVAGTGLKDSLTRLGDEIDAVAASLESISAPSERPEPIAPITSGADALPPGAVRGRERA